MSDTIVQWRIISNKECLVFKFKGYFTAADAKTTISDWRRANAIQPHNRIILIWDCLDMNNYETEARLLWQKEMMELKSNIESIWIISRSVFVNIGAKMISAFTGITIKTVSSESEIEFIKAAENK